MAGCEALVFLSVCFGQQGGHCMTHNGLRLGDGGAFEKRQLNIIQMPNRITNVEFTTVSPTIAKPMLCGRLSMDLTILCQVVL